MRKIRIRKKNWNTKVCLDKLDYSFFFLSETRNNSRTERNRNIQSGNKMFVLSLRKLKFDLILSSFRTFSQTFNPIIWVVTNELTFSYFLFAIRWTNYVLCLLCFKLPDEKYRYSENNRIVIKRARERLWPTPWYLAQNFVLIIYCVLMY